MTTEQAKVAAEQAREPVGTEELDASRPRSRPIRDLHRNAPEVVREAIEQGEVEITRYGEPVGYIISASEHRRQKALSNAIERAISAIDFERAMRAAAEGRVTDWDDVIRRLRAMVRQK